MFLCKRVERFAQRGVATLGPELIYEVMVASVCPENLNRVRA